MKTAALIGNPVAHSVSPIIYNYWFRATGIRGNYQAIQLQEKDLENFLSSIRKGNFVGCNVTIPFKEKVLGKLDALDNTATMVGAVNLIFCSEDGKLIGSNTDGLGFIENLGQTIPSWENEITVVMVMGIGGAARAVTAALLKKGKSVIVAGRNPTKLFSFSDFFTGEDVRIIDWDKKESILEDVNMLVNATPLGMVGYDNIVIDLSKVYKNSIVYDLVYSPLQTSFLTMAYTAGLRVVNGLGMLVRQAVPAFKVWFGEEPPINDELYSILKPKLKHPKSM